MKNRNPKIITQMIDLKNNAEGKVGYAVLWLLGVPLPILFVIYLLRGCN